MAVVVEFPAEIYNQFRPRYPKALYDLMKECLQRSGIRREPIVADIGCGSGQSTAGLAESGLAKEIIAVEPNAAMLHFAKTSTALQASQVSFVLASAENTTLGAGSVDAILCASAFHWMKKEEAVNEFLRILRRPGLLFFCEYSFPKSATHPRFDEWIRGLFRGEWQIPELRDRESFEEMVSVFAKREGVASLGPCEVPMRSSLGWRDLAGLIRSQSRYVRQLQKLEDERTRLNFDRETEEKVHELLGDAPDVYDFHLRASAFAAR